MTHQRDPMAERLKFSVTRESHDDVGFAFADHKNAWDREDRAAVRYQGGIVAYYSGHNSTYSSAELAARQTIPDRIAVLCGITHDALPGSIRLYS